MVRRNAWIATGALGALAIAGGTAAAVTGTPGEREVESLVVGEDDVVAKGTLASGTRFERDPGTAKANPGHVSFSAPSLLSIDSPSPSSPPSPSPSPPSPPSPSTPSPPTPSPPSPPTPSPVSPPSPLSPSSVSSVSAWSASSAS